MEWDCTANGWGNATEVTEIRNGGDEIDLVGHHPSAARFEVGDTILLRGREPGQTTRYLLMRVKRPGDPPDQWFGTAAFFPRLTVLEPGGKRVQT